MKIRSDFVSNSSSTSFVFVFDKGMTKNEFITKLGAKQGTYSAMLLDQVYDSLIRNSNEIKNEYEKYHKNEYQTFEEYLEKNKNFSDESIVKIKNAYKEGKTVLIGKFDSDGATTNMDTYLCLEDFLIDENGIYIDGLEDEW